MGKDCKGMSSFMFLTNLLVVAVSSKWINEF